MASSIRTSSCGNAANSETELDSCGVLPFHLVELGDVVLVCSSQVGQVVVGVRATRLVVDRIRYVYLNTYLLVCKVPPVLQCPGDSALLITSMLQLGYEGESHGGPKICLHDRVVEL